jgi:predicted porin
MRKIMLSTTNKTLLATFILLSSAINAAQITVKGVIEAGYIKADYHQPWLNSWQEEGVGILRYKDDDKLMLTQAAIEISGDLISNVNFDLIANYNPDGEKNIGLTEAYFTYSPLNPGLKHQVKFGMFYPQMSLENTATGWTSPYTYSFSAINSWIAEEQRTLGAQWSITRSGRKHNSPHSFTALASIFKANDGLGSLLVWRGWAQHNRQTFYNEAVVFSDYFSQQDIPINTPNFVEPFIETDSKWGYYVGGHWRYLKQTDVRVYYYDNRGDPNAIEKNRQYAWKTQYYSVAMQHKFTSNFRLLAQYLSGDTGMGSQETGVFTDISSWYVMFNYKLGSHRFSLRHDQFKVKETDQNRQDPNDSDGDSLTLAWRYQLDKNWNVGAEFIDSTSNNENRTLWESRAAEHRQKQYMAIVQYKF